MLIWQKILILIWGIIGLLGAIIGFKKCKIDKKQLDWDGIYTLYGAFVWGDITVFGIFWTIVSFVVLLSNRWIFFPVVFSVFWVVRSLGETIYWFNQQFSTIERYSPVKRVPWLTNIFHDNYTIWFIFQIWMQCITVVSIVSSVYFINLWLK